MPNKLRLVGLGTKIVVTIDVVAPPWGKGNRRTTSAEDGKGQDEEYQETGTIKSAGDQVRVVLEDARAVVAEVELDEEPGSNLVEDDASLGLVVRDIPGVLDKLGEVEIREWEASNLRDKLRALRVSEPETKTRRQIRYTHIYNDTVDGDGIGANCEPDGHNLVRGASFVEVFSQRPRSCVSVVRLHGRTAPGRIAIATNEEFAIAIHNRDHDGIIDESAQYSTIDLSKKHDTGRDLDCIDGSAFGSTDSTGK
jgi:hypothetical protein